MILVRQRNHHPLLETGKDWGGESRVLQELLAPGRYELLVPDLRLPLELLVGERRQGFDECGGGTPFVRGLGCGSSF